MSELWGDVGLSLLFWGFANEITKMENAKLLYPLFGIGANLAQTLGGLVLKFFSGQGGGEVSFASSLAKLMWMMMLCKGVVIALHFWMEQSSKDQRQVERERKPGHVGVGAPSGPSLPIRKRGSMAVTVMENNRHLEATVNGGQWHQNGSGPSTSGAVAVDRMANDGSAVYRVGSTIHQQATTSSEANAENKYRSKTSQKKLSSMREALHTLGQNPHIRALAIMAAAQSFAVNVMEFVWKSHLKLMYPTPAAFTGFLGDVATATGLVTGFLMFLSPIMFEKLGWAGVAGVTPNVLAYGGTAFFLMCFGYHAFSSVGSWGAAILPGVALGGATLFVLARGAKFSLFKPAEEMVYICLDEEGRTRGKAAVDVVGAQFGKSAGSVSQQVSTNNFLWLVFFTHLFFMCILMSWGKSCFDNKQYICMSFSFLGFFHIIFVVFFSGLEELEGWFELCIRPLGLSFAKNELYIHCTQVEELVQILLLEHSGGSTCRDAWLFTSVFGPVKRNSWQQGDPACEKRCRITEEESWKLQLVCFPYFDKDWLILKFQNTLVGMLWRP